MASVELIREGLALVDSGPLYATVMVSKRGYPLSEEAIAGAKYALDILKELASFLPVLKRKALAVPIEDGYPRVVKQMISAARIVADPDFTPMAAVAGATADMVADYLLSSDATRIIVDNGGDVAIRLRQGDRAEVGLCLDVKSQAVEYVFPAEESCGVCTSGFGGRSFSLGVADAAVTLADCAAVADAVATYLGNKTNVKSERVVRELAEEIYPDTDITGKLVTTAVGDLSAAEIEEALANGQRQVLKLLESGIIKGAILSVKNSVIPSGFFTSKMRRLCRS